MLNSRGFDLWADGYDASVGLSDEDGSYPFAGYRKVLGEIYGMIMGKPSSTVLDLGFGTATLTSKLYEGGHEIYGRCRTPISLKEIWRKASRMRSSRTDMTS